MSRPARPRVRDPLALRAVHPGGVARRAHAGRARRRPQARPARGAGRRAGGGAAAAARAASCSRRDTAARTASSSPSRPRARRPLLGAHPHARVPGRHRRRLESRRRSWTSSSTSTSCACAPRCWARSTPPPNAEDVPAFLQELRARMERAPRAHEGRCARLTRSARSGRGRGWPPPRAGRRRQRGRPCDRDRGGSATRGHRVLRLAQDAGPPGRLERVRFLRDRRPLPAVLRRAARPGRCAGPAWPGGGAQRRRCPPTRSRLTLGAPGERTARAKCAVVSTDGLRARDVARAARPLLPGPAVPADGGRVSPRTRRPRAGASTRSPRARADVRLGAAVAARPLRRRGRTAARCCGCPSRRRSGRSRTDRARRAVGGAARLPAAVYGVLLRELRAARRARAEHEPGTYALARPAGRRRAAAPVARTSGWSMVRATARWAKYVVTFDDWLEFILRKARRHSGQDDRAHARASAACRCVFLWPRVFRYLRHKDR